MKKNIALLFCILTFTSAIGFAKEATDSSAGNLVPENDPQILTFDSEALDLFSETDKLIGNGLEHNMGSILSYSQVLTEEEKQTLYDKYKKNPTAVSLLNGLVGFGAGYFSAGFPNLGRYNLRNELISCAVVAASSAMIYISCNLLDFTELYGGLLLFAGGWMGVIGGTVCDIIFRIDGATVGKVKANLYNETLRSALNYGQEVKVSVTPVVNPVSNVYGFAVQVKF